MAVPGSELTLLGVCDAELEPDTHRSSYLINKVGGEPDWPPLVRRHCPCCGRCGAPLTHVAQVYCPLDASYHRNLHVFACPAAACSGGSDGWTVLRSQCLETERRAPAREPPLAATDWCDTANDWDVEEEEGGGGGGGVQVENQAPQEQEEEAAEGGALSSRLQLLALGESRDRAPVLRSFFISVVEESELSREDSDVEHVAELLREYERREGAVAVNLLHGGEEKYEKSRARHGDAVFSRFMKNISPCPQQIVRYSRGGRPLFISEPPADMAQVVSACGACGGSRTFELQLMPALVSVLQEKQGGSGVSLEFGTVLVFTCSNSCWTAGSGSAVEEFCFVQADPDQQLFK